MQTTLGIRDLRAMIIHSEAKFGIIYYLKKYKVYQMTNSRNLTYAKKLYQIMQNNFIYLRNR